MRTLGIILFQLLFFTSAFGQSLEYSVHLNSGLFSFDGQSATAISFINQSDINTYTNNPYGKKNAPSYGLSVQIQRVTSGNILYGIQTGFESLRSSVQIDAVYEDNNSGTPTPASGNTIFRHSFINLHPRIGYRVPLQNIHLDITAGPEVGLMLNSKEIAEADLDGGGTVSAKNERVEEGNDYRLRTTLTAHYKKWGLSAGYSYGLRNYKSGYLGGANKAYSRFIRLGISYEIF